ncbi:MAG TPA: hypothetical protein VIM30_16850 [Candidatus Limnocylindrales bacterium]|jgi:hypothetical protein
MVLWAAGRWVNAWRLVRLGALATAALLFAHEAVYHLRFGFGPRLTGAMSAGGHDAYWRIFLALALCAAASLTLATAVRLAGLAWRVRRLERQPAGKAARSHEIAPGYRTELLGLWRRLYPTVALAFIAQENVERLAAGGGLPGPGILGGSGLLLALAVVGGVTLVVSAAGAIVRLRIRRLEAQLADAAAAGCHDRSRSQGLPRGWWVAAALCAQRWTIARQDSGRAPPAAFPA